MSKPAVLDPEHVKLIRVLKRTPLEKVKESYFKTDWSSWSELAEYFYNNGWTRRELVEADGWTGDWEVDMKAHPLACYLSDDPLHINYDYDPNDYDPFPSVEEIEQWERRYQNGLPTYVTTWHGQYCSRVIYDITYQQLLECLKESIWCNRDPDHCGFNGLPEAVIYQDEDGAYYQVFSMCMDS